MITAVDTCVLLDILLHDPLHYDVSHKALKLAAHEGRVIVSDLVVAELGPVLPEQIGDFLTDAGIDYLPGTLDAALEAGDGFAKYLRSGGKRGRVVADYIIAAHAKAHADRLLTRDASFKRTSIPKIKLWYP